ncbi:MAG: hypothetical protein LUC50_06180 [Ruminococcus sp.]|nr:hypothetical protein [Ruminococcus sp.]
MAHSLNSIGTKTLVVELGVGMRITQAYGKQLFDGIFNLMHEMGMWHGDVQPVREPIVSLDGAVEFLNSDAAGIFSHRKVWTNGSHWNPSWRYPRST